MPLSLYDLRQSAITRLIWSNESAPLWSGQSADTALHSLGYVRAEIRLFVTITVRYLETIGKHYTYSLSLKHSYCLFGRDRAWYWALIGWDLVFLRLQCSERIYLFVKKLRKVKSYSSLLPLCAGKKWQLTRKRIRLWLQALHFFLLLLLLLCINCTTINTTFRDFHIIFIVIIIIIVIIFYLIVLNF